MTDDVVCWCGCPKSSHWENGNGCYCGLCACWMPRDEKPEPDRYEIPGTVAYIDITSTLTGGFLVEMFADPAFGIRHAAIAAETEDRARSVADRWRTVATARAQASIRSVRR